MFSKLKTLTVLAAASATISVSAVAAPYVDVHVGPPPPRHEAVPAPRAGYVWAPGYWDWRGHRHVWVNGHWERARHGYVYHEPRWEQDGDRWRLYRGAWGAATATTTAFRTRSTRIPTTRAGRSAALRPARSEPRAGLLDESDLLGRRLAAEDLVAMREPAEALDHGAMTMRVVEHVGVLAAPRRRARLKRRIASSCIASPSACSKGR